MKINPIKSNFAFRGTVKNFSEVTLIECRIRAYMNQKAD